MKDSRYLKHGRAAVFRLQFHAPFRASSIKPTLNQKTSEPEMDHRCSDASPDLFQFFENHHAESCGLKA